MFRLLQILLTLGCAAVAVHATLPDERLAPRTIGSRTVILEFSVDERAKAKEIDVISSEARGLDPWAKSLVLTGRLKTTSPGVTKIADGRYRAVISFPIKDDGPPLPQGSILPKLKIQTRPHYPFDLARSSISGGALLRLTFNQKAKITKIEVVRASHMGFAKAAEQAVKSWEFSATAEIQEAPLETVLYQLITFELEGLPPASWEWQASPEPALPPLLVSGSYVPVNLVR